MQRGDDQGLTRGSRPQNARDRHARLLRLHVRRRHQVAEEMGAVVALGEVCESRRKKGSKVQRFKRLGIPTAVEKENLSDFYTCISK